MVRSDAVFPEEFAVSWLLSVVGRGRWRELVWTGKGLPVVPG